MNIDFASFLPPALISGAVSALVIYVARTWISERLKQAIGHEYAQKLEVHRASLKSEYDIQIERLRAENARQQAVEASARTSLGEAHLAAYERRVNAIDAAWDAILRIAKASSYAVIYLDILTDHELEALPQKQRARAEIQRAGGDPAIARIIDAGQRIDQIRPLVGDQIYALLYVYRAISARIEFLLKLCLQQDRFDPWWTDSGIRQHMSLVLDEAELARIDSLPVGRFGQLRSLLELKLLQEFNKIISGESAARFNIEKAAAIADAARRMPPQREDA